MASMVQDVKTHLENNPSHWRKSKRMRWYHWVWAFVLGLALITVGVVIVIREAKKYGWVDMIFGLGGGGVAFVIIGVAIWGLTVYYGLKQGERNQEAEDNGGL